MIYDFIIIGAGASGLMLVDALIADPHFSDARILLLDKELKTQNDRTWCFWEQGVGKFDGIVHKSWERIHIGTGSSQLHQNITPYTYKMVRGIDFYQEYLGRIRTHPKVDLLQETVLGMSDKEGVVTVVTDQGPHTGKKVFNSIFDYKILRSQKNYPVLQQHFIGWTVTTENPVFTPDMATFMDFSVPQLGNTRFMYVLPFSEHSALVEYTIFSETLLPETAYGEAIDSYLKTYLGSGDYTITERERGSIPMSCFDSNVHNHNNLLHIGLAGGWAKPSSGYTFKRSHKKTQQLLAHLKKDLPLDRFVKKDRFWFYDLLLLDILASHNSWGQAIFGQLFERRDLRDILKFLDEESSIWEDIKIIAACPKWDFIKALCKRLIPFS
ncbi:MAG: lycopene cyclase family protein [Sediminicola sp.]